MSTIDTNYTTDDDPTLLNPERGLFCNSIPDLNEDYHTLMPAYLHLDTVCGENLEWDGLAAETTSLVLKTYAQKLHNARAAGAKVVFRPRYDTQSDNAPSECRIDNVRVFHADSVARQKNHIDAIAKMLADYKDVVAFIQAGYLGKWGEWNTSGYSHSNAPFLYDDAIRAEIIDYALSRYNAYEIKQGVELRRPVFAKEVTDRNASANVGLHSDCFMSSDSDGGTYSDFEDLEQNFHDVELAKAWAREFTRDASFGGETCNLGGNERWRDCGQMLTEPATLHLNYLNGDYSEFAIGAWTDGGCFDEIRRKLGYRFEVTRVEYTPTVAPGGSFTVTIDISNSGWAKLHKPRTAKVVLRSSSTSQSYTPSNSATADWAPDTTTRLTLTDTAPMTTGTYSVRFTIPDPDAPTRISYEVKLASLRSGTNVFDANTGENNLGVTIMVQ
jgi:hypothetical protein